MNDKMAAYMDSLVEEVMQSEKFSAHSDSEKDPARTLVMNKLNEIVIQTLVDNLDGEQLRQFNNIDLNSEDEAAIVIQKLAMEVPHFYLLADQELKKAVENMKQAGLQDSPKPETSGSNSW